MELYLYIAMFVLMLIVLNEVIRLRLLIYNNIYNDVYELMTQILYELFDGLGNDKRDIAMKAYLREQRDDLYRKYLEAKRTGIKVFKDVNFVDDVLGSTRADLMVHGNFTDDFITKVEKSNRENMNRFLDMMLLDAQKRNYRKSLKLNLLNAYRKTINDIVRFYNQINAYKTHVVLETEDNASYMRFINRVELNKEELLQSIANNEIDTVLDVLVCLPVNECYKTQILMLKARLFDYKEKQATGIQDEKELLRITYSTIELIKEI
jgi:hypothetical protein